MRAWIYDWNAADVPPRPAHDCVEVVDETLRDGLQSPSVLHPSFGEKLEILRKMAQLGIETATIGLPGAGPAFARDTERLVRAAQSERLPIRLACAARTLESDIDPILRIADKTGVPIDVHCFLGSSPIRRLSEDWTLDFLLTSTEEAVSLAVRAGLDVLYITEDSTRARPEDLDAMYTAAMRCGAGRVCVSDTVGHATPAGAAAVVRFVSGVVERVNPAVKIDWHGHQDRGFGVANALAALEAGAHRVHACALGIGERVGNTPMEQLLVNLQLLGWIDRDLTALPEYARLVSEATGVPIPPSFPILGHDAFRTATGIHAAAILKARRKGDNELAEMVYYSFPASLVGRRQEIEVGPMSGESNVELWLGAHGFEATPERLSVVLAAAKASNRVLSDSEIEELVSRADAAGPRRVADGTDGSRR